MKLYTRWQNSAGERVRVALNLEGLAHEYVAVDSLPPGAYRALNPQGLMPTLKVNGSFIAQSAAILQYLEETRPRPPLLPDDPLTRAEARAFGAHVASEIHALTVNRVRKFLGGLDVSDTGVDRWTHHWLAQGFGALDVTLAARPVAWKFCYGETPGWADLHLVHQLANGRRLGLDLTPYGRLLGVENECILLDAFQRARPEAQPDYPGRGT
jgi:maleylacetoacetate isomerase